MGAVVGTAAGAIAGNTGKGAAIGSSSGALVGGMRRRDQKKTTTTCTAVMGPAGNNQE